MINILLIVGATFLIFGLLYRQGIKKFQDNDEKAK